MCAVAGAARGVKHFWEDKGASTACFEADDIRAAAATGFHGAQLHSCSCAFNLKLWYVQEEPRGVKRPRDEEAPLQGLSSLSIQGPTAGAEPGHLRPRSSLAAPSPGESGHQQRSRPGSSTVGSAGRRSRSPSGARSQRPATSPQAWPGSKQGGAARQGKSRGDSRDRDRSRHARR